MPETKVRGFVPILFAVIGFGALLIIWSLSDDIIADGPGTEVCDLIDNDQDGQVDEGFAVTCSENAECGPSGPYGERFCKDGDVWQGHYASTCTSSPGTCLSECASEQTERLITRCDDDCVRGRCV